MSAVPVVIGSALIGSLCMPPSYLCHGKGILAPSKFAAWGCASLACVVSSGKDWSKLTTGCQSRQWLCHFEWRLTVLEVSVLHRTLQNVHSELTTSDFFSDLFLASAHFDEFELARVDRESSRSGVQCVTPSTSHIVTPTLWCDDLWPQQHANTRQVVDSWHLWFDKKFYPTTPQVWPRVDENM